jgi:ketosteroid isomerase-like protein
MGFLMRNKLSAVLLPLVLVTACSSDAVSPPPKPPIGSLTPVQASGPGADTVTAKERALPDLYVKALSSPPGDGGALFSELAPLLNPDMAGFSSPGMSPVHDPAAIVAAHDKLFGAFDDRKMTLTRVWRTPSEQTIEWTMTGTQTREWKGVAPTRKPVAFKGVTLMWTKDDGSILDVHVYFDVTLVKAQLGTSPKGVDLAGLPLPTTPPARQEFDQAQPASADEEKNVAVVKAALDALENNSESGYVGAMADDVEVNTLERATPARGKADAKTYYKTMHKAIGQLDTTVIAAWGVGKFAIVEYSIAGEQLGPIMWIPAQRDRVVRWELVDICEIRDGKIARIWRYDNPGQIVD